METVLLVALSLLPVFALLIFFERKDKGRKEPLKLKRKVFAWGILITLIAAFFEIQVDDFLISVLDNELLLIILGSYLTAGLIEEGLKLWVVKKVVFKSKHFDETMDGIYYAIIASLGFAAFENILYVLQGGVAVGILRALLSVPAHALFSGVMGYYIGKAHFNPGKTEPWKWMALGLFYAVFYHGSFNFLLLAQGIDESLAWLILLLIPLFVIMVLHLKNCIKQAYYEDKLTKHPPAKDGVKSFMRFTLAVFVGLIGLAAIIGGSFAYFNPDQLTSSDYPEIEAYTQGEYISVILFSLFFLFLSYSLFRRRKK